jgi:hypothetical protein
MPIYSQSLILAFTLIIAGCGHGNLDRPDHARKNNLDSISPSTEVKPDKDLINIGGGRLFHPKSGITLIHMGVMTT